MILREIWQELRKFGLEYCDLPTMVTNLNCLLRFLTINIDRRNKKSIPIVFYVTTFVASAMFFYVYQFSVVWFIFVRSVSTGQLFCMIKILAIGIGCTVIGTKLIFLLLYQNTARDIVERYLAFDAMVIPGSRLANNLMKTLRTVKRRALVFCILLDGNLAAYITMNLMRPGRHLLEDSLIFYGLEPMFESPNYEIALVMNLIVVVFAIYIPGIITGFLIIVAGYTEAQMIALSEELRLLWNDAQIHYAENTQRDVEIEVNEVIGNNEIQRKIINEYIKNRLGDIIKFHTININLLRQVEKLFRGVFAVEFMLVILLLIGLLLSGVENAYLHLPFGLMLVGMDCLIGQKVMDASIVFEYAVYDSKWENFDVTNRKIVLLMLQNAQKNMTLSAGGVAKLNYACCMSVFRSAYSAFTALRSNI